MERRYELAYVVSPDATDEQVTEIHGQVAAIIERMGVGRIEQTDNWGRRRLAYEIGRHKEGTYVVETIVGTGELMKEIDRRFKVTDLIIRHLVVRVDEADAVAERARSRRTETSRRRRVARGLSPDRQPGEGQRGDDEDRDDRGSQGAEVDR
ncbi:MAG: 30S ribosomal protein S6 [Acidimicrobiia bacterium]|nr:30S ribosomal protein S6 [Acidimicrobiia bacterium]